MRNNTHAITLRRKSYPFTFMVFTLIISSDGVYTRTVSKISINNCKTYFKSDIHRLLKSLFCNAIHTEYKKKVFGHTSILFN